MACCRYCHRRASLRDLANELGQRGHYAAPLPSLALDCTCDDASADVPSAQDVAALQASKQEHVAKRTEIRSPERLTKPPPRMAAQRRGSWFVAE